MVCPELQPAQIFVARWWLATLHALVETRGTAGY